MENLKFQVEQKVVIVGERADQFTSPVYISCVYTPSQRKNLGYDYRVIQPSGSREEVDVKEQEVQLA